MRRRARAVAAVAFAVGAGAGLRGWALADPWLGALDADEAVSGLMALHALRGEWSTFYWGQTYAGSQEPLLAAPVLALTGASALALKLVTVSLFAAAAWLTARVGLRTVGARAAWIGAALTWVGSPYLVWWSTKARGFYGVGVVCSLAVLLFALRAADGGARRDVLALGAAVGVGWWATPLTAVVSVPAVVWLAATRRDLLRLAPLGVAAAVVGALPWLVWNAAHDWASFDPGPEPGDDTYVDRLHVFASATLPTLLGLREPVTLRWTLGAAAGAALLAAVAAAVAWAIVRRRAHPLLVTVVAAYPFLQALSPFAAFNLEPRYLVLLWPPLALLLAAAVARVRVTAWATVAASAALSLAGLHAIAREGAVFPQAGGRPVPPDLAPALAVLHEEGATRVLASYWIAYRITFESGERIVADSTGQLRYPPHRRLVRSDPSPARVFVAGGADERAARLRLQRLGFRRVQTGGWVVYVPRRPSDGPVG